MTADRRRFVWINAVLTMLVALALLFAPVAGAQAMSCHERQVYTHPGFEHSSIHRDVHSSLPDGLHTPDHKSCCTVACSFCVVLASTDRTEAPLTVISFFHFAWSDQTGRGLALPPTLGPPRLPV